jgi:hypothetical protein
VSANPETIWRLLEYFLERTIEAAFSEFSSLDRTVIRRVYSMGESERRELLLQLANPGITKPHHHNRDPSQAEKMRQRAADPSNR